ncbi:MAG: lipopolysaccharide core heptose(I) kinase RfaP [Planctomycetaceae bacterium]|nr:lipopolysaccharide core heptose(I) kinase RfaP [Planctomycetaceae bacterium]
MLELSAEMSALFGTDDAAFDRIFHLTGQEFRNREGRETLRVEIGGQYYFLKRHCGYGWKYILRTLLTGGFPCISARTELEAIRRFQQAGISTVDVVGFGERGRNPATRQSFLLMRELCGCCDLEQLCQTWPIQPPAPKFRQALMKAIGNTTRLMHSAGLNHRDYYLIHLWLEQPTADDGELRLHVIDLHRAMWHRRVPLYWRVKDLAALLFSARDFGITKSDCLRFLRAYRGRPLREVFTEEPTLWRLVLLRSNHLFRKLNHRQPVGELRVPRLQPGREAYGV